MRRASRIDENQTEIVKALRKHGISVIVISGVGNGVPDLIAGRMYGVASSDKDIRYPNIHITELLEVKDGEKYKSQRKLTPKEKKVHDEWRGRPIRIVESVADALKVFGINDSLKASKRGKKWRKNVTV